MRTDGSQQNSANTVPGDEPLLDLSITNYATLMAPKEAETFERYEEKFLLVKNKSLNEFLRVLSKYMDPSYPTSNTKFTLIENTYFDSHDLYSFRSHFQKSEKRHKLRARRYAPNGIEFSESVHLEVKEKKESVTKKIRFQVEKYDFLDLINKSRLVLTDSVLRLNPNIFIESLIKRIKKINKLFLKYNMSPHLIVSYKRRAFENNGLRVTIDENINFQKTEDSKRVDIAAAFENKNITQAALLMAKKLDQNVHAIIEVKHGGQIPLWLSELIVSVKAEPVSLSKYCVGVICSYYMEGF